MSQNNTVKVETILRIRPLDAKHKLKQDYYTIHTRGLPEELKKGELPPSLKETQKQVLTVLGHPMAWAQPAASQQKLKSSHFIFDKIFNSDTNNAQFHNEGISTLVLRTLSEGDTSCLILGFGHHHSGKTHTLLGQNNYQLHKSITDVPLREAQDSRGSLLRTIADIKGRDPTSKIKMSFIDLAIDNVRDLMRHVKKERIKSQSILAVNFSDKIFGNNAGSQNGASGSDRPSSNLAFNRMTEEEKQFQLQIIEKEYVKVEQGPTKSQAFWANPYHMHKLAQYEVTDDLSETAFIIDKCHEQSHKLNERVGYSTVIRQIQVVAIKVITKAGRKCSIIFVDLGDYEKLLSNIIDHQKVYEMIEYNNSLTVLANILSGFKSGSYTVTNAPYGNSRLTQIIQALLNKSKTRCLNIGFVACVWPIETLFPEVINSLNYTDRFNKLDDPSNLYQDVEHFQNMRNRLSELQEITRDNMALKQEIDQFRRKHQHKLSILKDKLGINVTVQQFESIIKSRPGTREYNAAREHKDFVEKTESMAKNNKDIEDQIAAIRNNMEDDEAAKQQIQEGFSQKLFTISRKIEVLRETLKIAEADLDHTLRDQLQLKTEELQRALDTTHAQLLENTSLVEYIISDSAIALSTLPVEPGHRNLVTKAPLQGVKTRTTLFQQAATRTLPQHLNLTKDESKKVAEEHYEKLLQKSKDELEAQLQAMTEKYEDVIRQKEEDLQKAADTFKETHEKLKRQQYEGRAEIVRVYNMALTQDQVLQNVENGVYSQTTKRIVFGPIERPLLANATAELDFLNKSLAKVSQVNKPFNSPNTAMKAIKIKKIAQDEIMNELNTTEGEKLEKVSVIEEPNFKDVDSMVDPEALRAYVKELMVEVKSNLSSSHPSILKGENVETVVRETERYKKTCETAQRKMNEIRVQQEATKRLIERVGGYSTKSSLF